MIIKLLIWSKTHDQTSSVLNERYPGVWGLSSWSVRRICSKKNVSPKVTARMVPAWFQQTNICIFPGS